MGVGGGGSGHAFIAADGCVELSLPLTASLCGVAAYYMFSAINGVALDTSPPACQAEPISGYALVCNAAEVALGVDSWPRRGQAVTIGE